MEIVIEVGVWKSLCWRELSGDIAAEGIEVADYGSRGPEKPAVERAFGGYSSRGLQKYGGRGVEKPVLERELSEI